MKFSVSKVFYENAAHRKFIYCSHIEKHLIELYDVIILVYHAYYCKPVYICVFISPSIKINKSKNIIHKKILKVVIFLIFLFSLCPCHRSGGESKTLQHIMILPCYHGNNQDSIYELSIVY